MIGIVFLGSWAGCIAGNFIYQAFRSSPNYEVAWERSWFQTVAVFGVWLCCLLARKAGVQL